jgi:hypothetical protein
MEFVGSPVSLQIYEFTVLSHWAKWFIVKEGMQDEPMDQHTDLIKYLIRALLYTRTTRG